jgi:enoyl-CoA hydratase/carnithine racemase
MAHEVLTEVDGRIGRITLNRPDAYNAITIELARSLERALRDLGGAPGVNVIVIRGAGGNFSVGGDFNQLERLRATGVVAMRELFESFAAACGVIASLPVPVIAAVEGYAMAGGFELMQAADFALVRDDAKLADNHTNFGLIPGGGSSQRLPRLVGRQRALGLILTGDRLSGADAAAWGLAYRACPAGEFDAAVEELARKLAAKSRDALTRCKRLVYDGLGGSLDDGIRLEVETVLEHLESDAGGEAFERFAARSSG